jgi:hypothetical protein
VILRVVSRLVASATTRPLVRKLDINLDEGSKQSHKHDFVDRDNVPSAPSHSAITTPSELSEKYAPNLICPSMLPPPQTIQTSFHFLVSLLLSLS